MICIQDKTRGVGRMSGDAGGDTLMTPDHTDVQVRSHG